MRRSRKQILPRVAKIIEPEWTSKSEESIDHEAITTRPAGRPNASPPFDANKRAQQWSNPK
jgi:hypothetical protein